MNVSMHADYAFRVLMYLALNGRDLVQISTISEAYGISENHVTKVIQRLSKFGYVEAIRGRHGGVRLIQAPENVNLGRVFRQMEPNIDLLECFDHATNSCPIIRVCGLSHVFSHALDAFLKVLDQSTLSSVLVNKQPLRKVLDISLE